jgi:hypothetical protein
MRKLGQGHSLVFFIPPEVRHSILHSLDKAEGSEITSADVLKWTINQTCARLSRNASHWALQGTEHVQRGMTFQHYITDGNIDEESEPCDATVKQFMEDIEHPECRTLDQLYGIHPLEVSVMAKNLTKIEGHPYATALQKRWDQLDLSQTVNLSLGEEQEREVSMEVEQQEIVEHPLPVEPRKPKLREDVKNFVRDGTLSSKIRAVKDSSSSSLFPISVMLNRTAAVPNEDFKVWDPAQLFVTREYVESVSAPKDAKLDFFLRPVRWILSSILTGEVLIIAPYEANELLENIRESRAVRLHLYSARVSQNAQDLSGLDFHTVSGEKSRTRSPLSEEVIRDINLAAGSLYLKNYEEYQKLLKYLGIVEDMQDKYHTPGWNIGGDGFADPGGREIMRWGTPCPFKRSPVPFFHGLFSVWQKGQDFTNTHLGHVVSCKPLKAEDFATKGRIKTETTDIQEKSLFVREDSPMRDRDGAELSSFASGSIDPMDLD